MSAACQPAAPAPIVSQTWLAIRQMSPGSTSSAAATEWYASGAGLWRRTVSSTLKRRSNTSITPACSSCRPEIASVLSVSVNSRKPWSRSLRRAPGTSGCGGMVANRSVSSAALASKTMIGRWDTGQPFVREWAQQVCPPLAGPASSDRPSVVVPPCSCGLEPKVIPPLVLNNQESMIQNGWWYYGPDAMTSTEQQGAAADGGRGGKSASPASAWAPFRHRLFAAMWGGQFVSNIGGWMQTVAAQWLMLTLTGSAAYVALVQTAAGLPVLLFAIVAGTAGDLVDRRRFLLGTQTFMLAAAAALGGLAIAGLVTPWVLLALVFAVGTGQALTSPTWQTLQPELVSPAERTQAISLGSVNQNLARAVGPAIGGALLAATSAGTVFLVNAASFIVVIGVIAAWRW